MDYKTNYRYFHKSLTPLIVGIVLAILGFINWYFGFLIDSWFTYNLTVVVMIVGLIIVLFFLVATTRDSQYDSTVKTKIKPLLEVANEKALASDKHVKIIDDYVAESFLYGDRATELKKGRDGSFRTDVYSATAFLISPHKLFVYNLTFSLIENKETESFKVFTYDAIEDISVVPKVINIQKEKNVYEINTHSIDIKTPDGIYSFTTHNDSLADGLILKVKNRKDKDVNGEN